MVFIDVILPIPLSKSFTYRVTEAELDFLKPGMRVAVPFGKSKIYTGLVLQTRQQAPQTYEAKEIHQILDDQPMVTEQQLEHWQWIASYYLCTLGEVFRAAVPAAFLLQSETIVYKNSSFQDSDQLTDQEFLVYEALSKMPSLTVQQITEILSKQNVLPIIQAMLIKKVVVLKEEIFAQYKPKLVNYVRLCEQWQGDDQLELLLNTLTRSEKQRALVLTYFSLQGSTDKPIKVKELLVESGVSNAVLKGMVDKEVMEIYQLQMDRVQFSGKVTAVKALSEAQEKSFQEIKIAFQQQKVALLHGVTGSGKTEVYVQLMSETLQQGKQVLYLLPEIALTTQLIMRLQAYFGEKVAVFHSKYSMNERVEVWNNVLHNKSTAQIVIGARSALFMPFSQLGLIIVDEEHESSYKQFDPAPRYHARDAAIVLAQQAGVQVVLGSATPSLESIYNVQEGKYVHVELIERYGNVELPTIELIDLKEAYRKKRIKGNFSNHLLQQIQEALDLKEQVILFQNRRGFSPVVSCQTCGDTPQCSNCDVSLTYHKFRKELRCHYCNYRQPMQHSCMVCGSHELTTRGFGTEQLELELQNFFPKANVGRMDLDTTRGKYAYQKIIESFQVHEIDILVGTQMLSKGLDFKNVSLVGVLNADTMLNFPDFRAHERSYQLMVQVAGRAGRSEKQGRVVIQTYSPQHSIIQQVTSYDYEGMCDVQLAERHKYRYPPYGRLIRFTLRHKVHDKVQKAAAWLGKSLQNSFSENVLGPTTPAVGRVRNQFLQHLILKISPDQSLAGVKVQVQKILQVFNAVGEFRGVRVGVDVDVL